MDLLVCFSPGFGWHACPGEFSTCDSEGPRVWLEPGRAWRPDAELMELALLKFFSWGGSASILMGPNALGLGPAHLVLATTSWQSSGEHAYQALTPTPTFGHSMICTSGPRQFAAVAGERSLFGEAASGFFPSSTTKVPEVNQKIATTSSLFIPHRESRNLPSLCSCTCTCVRAHV